MKRIIYFFLAIYCVAATNSVNAQTACQTSNGAITDTNSNCYAKPLVYKAKIYKVGVCKSQPVAPTQLSPIDLSSCTAVFTNDSGYEASLNYGAPVNLIGITTKPTIGNYSYTYAIVDPTFKVTSKFTFSANRTNKPSNGAPTSGVVCWSKAGIFYSFRSSLIKDLVDCGTEAQSAPSETLSKTNALGVTNNLPLTTKNFSTFTGYLVDQNFKTATTTEGSMGTTAYIIAVAPSNISITSSTNVLDISFDVTNGTTLEINNIGYQIEAFGVGPVTPVITIK
jgi:hypothetical protein